MILVDPCSSNLILQQPQFTEHEEKDQDEPGLFDIPDADVEMASEHSHPSSCMCYSHTSSHSEHSCPSSHSVTLPPLTDSDHGFPSSAPNSDNEAIPPQVSSKVVRLAKHPIVIHDSDSNSDVSVGVPKLQKKDKKSKAMVSLVLRD